MPSLLILTFTLFMSIEISISLSLFDSQNSQSTALSHRSSNEIVLRPDGVGYQFQLVHLKLNDTFLVCYHNTLETGVWSWKIEKDFNEDCLLVQGEPELSEDGSECQRFQIVIVPQKHKPLNSDYDFLGIPIPDFNLVYINSYPFSAGLNAEPYLTYTFLIILHD